MSDEEAIDRGAYDLRWKVALGLEISEKLCAKSTPQLFRSKLVLNEVYQELFNKSIEVCREAGGDDPGWRYPFSRKDCTGCALRAKCTRAECNSKVVQITAKTEAFQPLRCEQRTPEFRAKYRERGKVEYRIGRWIQLGVRQALYLGKAKLAFQITMVATVANLTLAISQSGFESLLFLLSALIVPVATERPNSASANMHAKIMSHCSEMAAVAPAAAKIAICRPLF